MQDFIWIHFISKRKNFSYIIFICRLFSQNIDINRKSFKKYNLYGPYLLAQFSALPVLPQLIRRFYLCLQEYPCPYLSKFQNVNYFLWSLQIWSKKLCKYNTLSSSLKIVQSHQTQPGGCRHCILCQMFFKEILRLLKIFNPRTTLFTTDIIIIIIMHILIEFIL